MTSVWRRALLSIVVIGLPLALMPPWRHLESIDPAFWNVRFGDFDRHALFWRPPFADAVASNPALRSPVEWDALRFTREWCAGTFVTFLLLTTYAAPRRSVSGVRVVRPPFGRMAPLLALLLPIPPVGLLAFSSWESLTDSNHGVPFIVPTLLYWAALTAIVYVALHLGWYLWNDWRRESRPSR